MKRKNSILPSIAMLIITGSMLIVFSERIASKPRDAGFWFIFAFGMSVGVALVQIIYYFRQKRSEK